MQQFPEGTPATVDGFRRSGCNEAVRTAKHPGYSPMWSVLSQAANKALRDDKLEEAKVLWLIADACSLSLAGLRQKT